MNGGVYMKSSKSYQVKSLELLQKKINYIFKNTNYLKTALSHTSHVNEHRKSKLQSNERQEFLGDAVLELIVTDYLFRKNPDLPEGVLTKIRSVIVCEKTLSQFADEISLGEFLLLGNGEESAGGRHKPSILADAFEALIAAIYLDANFEMARQFVEKFVRKFMKEKREESTDSFTDYKTMLQEIVQKNPTERISYSLVSEEGPDHNKRFTIELLLNNNVISRATSKSKKAAEQLAAKEALSLMGIK